MASLNDVRRCKDGSIDTDFYVAIGNLERGRAMRRFWARLFGRSRPEGRRTAKAHALPRGRALAGR